MAQATQQPRSGFLRGAHLDVVAASQLRNKSEQVNQMPLITRFRAELQSKFKTYITDGFPDADIERALTENVHRRHTIGVQDLCRRA